MAPWSNCNRYPPHPPARAACGEINAPAGGHRRFSARRTDKSACSSPQDPAPTGTGPLTAVCKWRQMDRPEIATLRAHLHATRRDVPDRSAAGALPHHHGLNSESGHPVFSAPRPNAGCRRFLSQNILPARPPVGQPGCQTRGRHSSGNPAPELAPRTQTGIGRAEFEAGLAPPAVDRPLPRYGSGAPARPATHGNPFRHGGRHKQAQRLRQLQLTDPCPALQSMSAKDRPTGTAKNTAGGSPQTAGQNRRCGQSPDPRRA